MTNHSIGDALQEQWRNTAKDAAFGRAVKALLTTYENCAISLNISTQAMLHEIRAAHKRVYAEDKDNG